MIDPILEIKVNKYGTTKSYCGCPDYLYRQSRVQGSCKHMNYLNQRDNEIIQKRTSESKFDPNDFRGKGMDLNDAGEKYGDKVLTQWKKMGRIFKSKYKWKILE